MEINIKLAESLIDAFDSEDTAIVLWDKDDNVIYRNKKTSERWIKLKLDFEIGQNFYDRIKKVVDLGLMTDEEIHSRRKNYELAKTKIQGLKYRIDKSKFENTELSKFGKVQAKGFFKVEIPSSTA